MSDRNIPAIYAETIMELKPLVVHTPGELASFLFDNADLVEIDVYDPPLRRELAAHEAGLLFDASYCEDGVNAWRLVHERRRRLTVTDEKAIMEPKLPKTVTEAHAS